MSCKTCYDEGMSIGHQNESLDWDQAIRTATRQGDISKEAAASIRRMVDEMRKKRYERGQAI